MYISLQIWASVITKWPGTFKYYEACKLAVQSRTGITKCGNFYDKVGSAIVYPDNFYYKMG